MCKRLWDNNIYEAELYQIALRYRDKYDKTYNKNAGITDSETVD